MGICIPNYTAEHWTYSALQDWELYFFRFIFALKLVYFSDLLGFKMKHAIHIFVSPLSTRKVIV